MHYINISPAIIGTLIIIMLLLSGGFSAIETALLSVNKHKIKSLVDKGDKRAKKIFHLHNNIDKTLSIILLCNCLINVGLASFAGFITADYFNQKYSIIFSTIITTTIILIVAEITPKILGSRYSYTISLMGSYIIGPLGFVLWPLIFITNNIARLLTICMGFNLKDYKSHIYEVEEIKTLLNDTNIMSRNHRGMMLRMLDINTLTVEDVMVHKNFIEFLDVTLHNDELLRQLRTSHHARIILCTRNIDNVVGVLNTRKVIALLDHEEISSSDLVELSLSPHYVPAYSNLLVQLQLLLESKMRMALVVDEYGDICGLITVEDILSEIIGEFTSDPNINTIPNWNNNTYVVVHTNVNIREINRALGLKLPTDIAHTLNGLIANTIMDFPNGPISFKIANVKMEAITVSNRGIRNIKIFKPR